MKTKSVKKITPPSEALELRFNNRGFLMIYLNTAQRDNTQNLKSALMIYNIDENRLELNTNSEWKGICSDGSRIYPPSKHSDFGNT
ncbi:MAG: hypothetical protein ACMUEM_03850 [Flavobacteriales bacterium AspAUS03]